MASPTISSPWIRVMPLVPAITVSAASSTSASPGRGRLRRAARAVAARVAAMRSSGDADMPRSRSSRAAPTNQRPTPASPGCWNTCAYQPGLRTPAPYPLAEARRRWVHGTQLNPTFTLGNPRRMLCIGRRRRKRLGQCRHVPRAAHDRDSLMPVGDRPPQRLAHVRLALRLARRRCIAATAYGGHRCGDRVERRRAIATVLDHVVPPSFGVRVAGRCGQRCQRVADRHRPAVRRSARARHRRHRVPPTTAAAVGRSPAASHRGGGPRRTPATPG